MRDLLDDSKVPSDSLSRVWVDTRQSNLGFQLLEELMVVRGTANHAFGTAVLGPARFGKTSFVTEFLRRRKDDGHGLNYLYVELKADTKPSSIAYETLAAMDDPDPSYGRPAERTARVYDFIKRRGFDLIIYDEAHYLVDSKTLNVQEDGVGWFVGLLNECRVPMLLVGYERVEAVIERNASLGGRLLPFPTFRQLDHTDPNDMKEFLHVLRNLEGQLGLPMPSNLSEPDLAARICYCCLGRLGYLEVFLTSARGLARRRRHSCLMTEVLRDTAAIIGQKWNKRAINPFVVADLQAALEAVEGKRRDGKGERG